VDGMNLAKIAQVLGARYRGPDVNFLSVSTDTRTLKPGDLFVALQGPRFDGHAFLEQARARGAIGAVVSRAVSTSLPTLKVKETCSALGALAAHWRGRMSVPVIGVTGSNGKTTVKEMLKAILNRRGPLLTTLGNMNNEVGLPLTLLKLRTDHHYAVVEMGASGPGDIAYLGRIARPDVALITNAGPAHLERFGTLEGVAQAKGEIFSALSEGGIAVINADDSFASLWRELAGGRRTVLFGLCPEAEVSVRAADLKVSTTQCTLQTPAGTVSMKLPLPGKHNLSNALGSAAVAFSLGLSPDEIRAGLESIRPVCGRLETRAGIGGAWVIDDTYNANPGSLRAALEVLRATPGEHWLVLGDMAELGESAWALHEAAGREVRSTGVTHLYTVGEFSRAAVLAFGAGARHFPAVSALIESLQSELKGDVTVLVKGSRCMRMERVVAALTAHPQNAAREG
jgi:UDP-N-acetylmuramoyl-tripeptide--D-alanyl-D-alanine ligase